MRGRGAAGALLAGALLGSCGGPAVVDGVPPPGSRACAPQAPTICHDMCVNLAIDDANCGACGQACAPGATCIRGVCGPSPETVVVGHDSCNGMRLAGTADALYWTDTLAGRIMRMPAAGGPPEAISGDETKAPTLLAVAGGSVFWLDGTIVRARMGAAVSEVYASPSAIQGMAIDDTGTTLYFSSAEKIQRVPVAGGAGPTEVAVFGSGVPSAIAFAGDFLAAVADVVAIVDLRGPVAQCQTIDPGGGRVDLNCGRAPEPPAPLLTDSLLALGTTVVFAEGINLIGTPLPIQGRPKADFLASSSDGIAIAALASSSGAVYFGTYTGSVAVVKSLVQPTSAVRLARDLGALGSLAVAGAKLYMATINCEIQAIPLGN